jgi:hypothetical protein
VRGREHANNHAPGWIELRMQKEHHRVRRDAEEGLSERASNPLARCQSVKNR